MSLVPEVLMHLFALRSICFTVVMCSLSISLAYAGDDGQASLLGAFIDKFTGKDDLSQTTPPITYHERAPLILPKHGVRMDLPPPSEAPRTESWPNDPDIARLHKAKGRTNTPQIIRNNEEK